MWQIEHHRNASSKKIQKPVAAPTGLLVHIGQQRRRPTGDAGRLWKPPSTWTRLVQSDEAGTCRRYIYQFKIDQYPKTNNSQHCFTFAGAWRCPWVGVDIDWHANPLVSGAHRATCAGGGADVAFGLRRGTRSGAAVADVDPGARLAHRSDGASPTARRPSRRRLAGFQRLAEFWLRP